MDRDSVIHALRAYDGPSVKIMEVCGTHTHAIFKNGIRSLISEKIQLISGPGCPVCVTPTAYIDQLVDYATQPGCCVLTFGDMMKVPGTRLSLAQARAENASVRIIYSPLQAVDLAMEQPDTHFVVAAVGFETTIPAYALLIRQLIEKNIRNIRLLTAVKTILPALEFICESNADIDGFLSPGHASVLLGSDAYLPLCQQYQKPFVVAGFEAEHILAAVYEIIDQLKTGRPQVKNLYQSVVTASGNTRAWELIREYFEPSDAFWRGIGLIPGSGMQLKEQYQAFDAGSSAGAEETMPHGCGCADVILGKRTPPECPLFDHGCNPVHPIGPCMVSAEGACGIWYRFIGGVKR